MPTAFELITLIAAICSILSFAMQIFHVVRKAWEKAKPSGGSDGFDTGSKSQGGEPLS